MKSRCSSAPGVVEGSKYIGPGVGGVVDVQELDTTPAKFASLKTLPPRTVALLTPATLSSAPRRKSERLENQDGLTGYCHSEPKVSGVEAEPGPTAEDVALDHTVVAGNVRD